MMSSPDRADTQERDDESKGTTSGIAPKEEEAMDKALQAEDEADEAAAEEVIASDEDHHGRSPSE